MGWITTINPRTGREVLACDACGAIPIQKHKCPHGYCQAYALCSVCWAKVKDSWKARHEYCKVAHASFVKMYEEQASLLDSGKYLRVAALAHAGGKVKVIFRNKNDAVRAFWMDPQVYAAIPLGSNATIEMYGQSIVETKNISIYVDDRVK